MKKILSVLVIVFILFSLITSVWAYDSNTIEISFKVGDQVLKINGKDVEVEKPFVVNGTTLVPLRVITEAFGTEVQWNGEERSILLSYSDVEIQLTIDNNIAIINGKDISIQEAPRIVNDITMVPLRFITENFGADVKYDDETAQITVTKETASANSIMDFALILKRTTKEKVGDSFYGWSMDLPKNLEISYRNFSGTYSSFNSDDDTYSLSLYISNLEDETLDSLLMEGIQYASNYTILYQGKENKNGQQYVRIAYKTDYYTCEDRVYIKDDKIFGLTLEVWDHEDYKNNQEMLKLLDSFKTEFLDAENIEDLSDVTEEGYRPYENKHLKLSVNILADWDEIKEQENHVRFVPSHSNNVMDDGMFVIKMYSKEEGLTLEQWLKDELKLAEDYNPDLAKIIETSDATINGIKAKKLVSSIKIADKLYCGEDYYMIAENYRYQIGFVMGEEKFNNPVEKLAIEKMLQSFKFTEPDFDEVGMLIDPDRLLNSDEVKKINNKEYKWSCEIPITWTESSTHNGTNIISYSDKDGMLMFTFSILKDTKLDEFIKYYEGKLLEDISATGLFKNDKKEVLNEKGTKVYKYSNSFTVEGLAAREVHYLFEKNGHLCAVNFYINDLKDSKKSRKIIEDIWQSIQFE